MTNKESSNFEAIGIFHDAIHRMRTSGVEGVSDMAGRTADWINRRETRVIATDSIPTVTDFNLVEYIPGDNGYYAPAIFVNIEKILVSTSEEIQADLARTVAIADQFPANGFERRYREVYGRALDAQEQWLDRTSSASEIELDPRKTDREVLLKMLLGEERYYGDVGIEDWQKAVDGDMKGSKMDLNRTNLLNRLRVNLDHFIVVRHRFVPMNFQTAIEHLGEKRYKEEWSHDERAKVTAASLLDISIVSSPPTIKKFK